jgi:hypothetical protein
MSMMKKLLTLLTASATLVSTSLLTASPAFALDSDDVTASLSASNGTLSTTLSFTDPNSAPTIVLNSPSAGQLAVERIVQLGFSQSRAGSVTFNRPSSQEVFGLQNFSAAPQSLTQTGTLSSNSTAPFIAVCWEGSYNDMTNFTHICSETIANPNLRTVVSQPILSLNGSTVVKTDAVWSGGTITHEIWACGALVVAQTAVSATPIQTCNRLESAMAGFPTDLSTARIVGSGSLYSTTYGAFIVLLSRVDGQSQYIWTASVVYTGESSQITNGGAGSDGAPAPIKYSGPEFSELSLKPALAGSSATLEGRKLDQISSVTIGGKAAVLSNATDKSVNIGLPAGLAPGVYDLVVTTANHGKLTHMNAIRVREVLPETSLTIKGTGVFTGEEFKKLTAFSRTQNPDMNTVTCIVNSNSEGKSFMQARALCDRIAATNLNVKTTKIESRSTVESSAIFARVVFSSEE